MLHKDEFLKAHTEMHEGMTVYTIDGEKLGTVREFGEDNLVVEKGFFFPKDFTFRYDDIADVRSDTLIINKEEGKLEEWRSENYEGWKEYERRNAEQPRREPETRSDTEIRSQADTRTEPKTHVQAGTQEQAKAQSTTQSTAKKQSETIAKHGVNETRTNAERTEIPLFEERLETEKVKHEKGSTTVRKVVHTEIKNVEVPVTMEEVVIERKSVEGEGTAPGEKAFKEEEINIPISEEEVKVTKHPVEKERVEIRKQTHTEKKTISEQLRSEDLEIEEKGDLKREKK